MRENDDVAGQPLLLAGGKGDEEPVDDGEDEGASKRTCTSRIVICVLSNITCSSASLNDISSRLRFCSSRCCRSDEVDEEDDDDDNMSEAAARSCRTSSAASSFCFMNKRRRF